ncbi:MAG: pseudouridine synthase [Clostridium perfringens]|nr:pseudouridine synthase [Clostridium perfringens]
MRLDKFLAQAAIGKRKDVRDYIKNGLVKVNGKTLMEPALEIREDFDIIEYKDVIVKSRGKIYYMFNKPQGCITATRDKESKTVFDYFNEDMNGVFHVGRLDKDTEGLLLLTNDGEFEHHLMHPTKHVNKTYFFWALGSLSKEDKKSLEEGLYIGKGEILTKPAKIEIHKEGNYLDFKDEVYVESLYSIDSKNYNQAMVSGYLTISEGRKHQVKRMLKAVGCYVVYLKRIAIGGLKLDESLEKGEYRNLTDSEINMLLGDALKEY